MAQQEKPEIMRYFTYTHLPSHLQDVSAPICEFAEEMLSLPESEQRTQGLQRLLEAKDCFVRAAIY